MCKSISTQQADPSPYHHPRQQLLNFLKHVYRCHLKDYFGLCTLQKYQPAMGARWLDSWPAKQGYYVLKHIRAVGSATFKRAVKDIVNPWSAVAIPEDAVEPSETTHYTREQGEDLVTALLAHFDCQLVLSLRCFAVGPAEIAGPRSAMTKEEAI